MPKKGRTTLCVLGPQPKKRSIPTPQGFSQIVANLEASDADWVNNQSQHLQNTLANARTPWKPIQIPHNLPVEEPRNSFDPDIKDDILSNINPEEDHLINFFLLQGDNNDKPPKVVNFGDLIQGSTYKGKNIKEAKNWAEALGPMFLDFIVCSQRTSQWGDARWNPD
ncbi:hypothetical protein DFH28DRAFT_1077743 [Melampsora americana]|nr:hypothetical protein DFH28DRAFT_1077743 [Melampsora americana]